MAEPEAKEAKPEKEKEHHCQGRRKGNERHEQAPCTLLCRNPSGRFGMHVNMLKADLKGRLLAPGKAFRFESLNFPLSWWGWPFCLVELAGTTVPREGGQAGDGEEKHVSL